MPSARKGRRLAKRAELWRPVAPTTCARSLVLNMYKAANDICYAAKRGLRPFATTSTLGLFVMKVLFKRLLQDESGATAIEYGLIASLIAVVIIGAVTTVGSNLTNVFTKVSGNIN
jgi:pilus assembly protein Flp/PilA